MKTQKLLIVIVSFIMIISSCRKIDDNPQPINNPTMDQLVIPENFNWETYQDINLSISVELTQNTTALSKISIFNGNPDTDGKLVVSGSASRTSSFDASMRIPSSLNEIYLMCEFPFGGSKIQAVPVEKLINYTFTNAKSSNLKSGYKSVSDVGPECVDCDLTISGSGSYEIGGGQKVCVTDNFTGSITFLSWDNGGTLQVCGTASISELTLTENAHIIVTQDGSLTIGSFSAWGTTGTITVYENAELIINNDFQTQGSRVENQGMLTVNGDMTVQNLSSGEFVNSGILTLNGNFQLNNGPTFYNYGTVKAFGTSFLLNNNSTCENTGILNINSTTANNFQINSGSDFTNNGNLDVKGDISINAGSTIINNCTMICTETFAVNSGDFITTSGFLKGAQEVNLNFTNNIQLREGSMISTVDLTMNSGGVVGSGSLNSILVSGTFTIHSTNKVDGSVESATDDLVMTSGGIPDHFINGATVVGLDGITNFIEIGSCNPDGVGMEIMTDSDGDGVPDEVDDYPYDIYRAYNNYFPDETGSVTLVFEDLWPNKGDYDFNDLVVGVYGNEITNASNDVVEIDINFNVKAVGAAYQNGFGWQFAGILPSQIEQVTGTVLRDGGESIISLNANGTEQGQDSAVIIAVENIEDVINRAGGSMFNTLDNGLVGTSDLVEVNILFGETTPINRDLIGAQAYNIFLIKNQIRGTEIHMPDREPTNKMTTSLLGTGQDVSDPNTGTYYKTASHLPWALMIMADFDYPIEKIAIIDAYPDFADWAQSGGTLNTDWYENPVPSKIWTP